MAKKMLTSDLRPDVQAEVEAMDRTFRRIIKTRETALAFLQRAGIADKNGRLAKQYRTTKPPRRPARSTG